MENQENLTRQENHESEEETIQRLRNLIRFAAERRGSHVELHVEKIEPFANLLMKKYSKECYSCRLYHLLIGSSPLPSVPITRFDFPGEDSIQKFIENL